MLLKQAIYQLLANNAGVNAVAVARIYPGTLPQTVVYPAIAYRKIIPRPPDPILSSKTTGPTESHFIFYSVAQGTVGAKTAERLSEAVRLCLQGYSGLVTLTDSSPVETFQIHGIFWQGDEDAYDDKTQTHQVASVYSIHHAQEIPS